MKLSQITPAPWNTRTAITDESVRSLAASMDADGLIQPISVCDNADGDGYICYDGNRRLAAARLLGWDEIAANYADITPDEAKVRTVTANLQREADDPLLAAGVIGAMLDEGLDAGEIAAKLGKTAAWVNRRRKMLGAADALKACADKVTVDALERVAVLPEKVQASVCKQIEAKAKYMGRVGLNDIRYDIEREMRDLDEAMFDTALCAACPNRTGAEQDLFGEVADGKLGKCLNCKCFERKVKEWEDAEIAKLVGDAEVVRVKYTWELPEDGKAKRDKNHPCAYVWVNGEEIEVRWDESADAKKKRKEAEEKKREEEREAERAERAREDEIVAKLEAWKDSGKDGEYPAGLCGAILEHAQSRWCVQAVADKVVGWQSNGDWAEILEELPEVAKFAGLTDEDCEYLVGRFADENEEEN